MTFASVMSGKSPTVWLRLGEASGTSASDASGNGHAGTYVGSPTLGATGLLAGDSDTAVSLNGSSQYVTIPASAAFDSSSAISGFARVKITTTSNRYIISRRDSNSGGIFNFQIGAKLYVELFATGGYTLAQSSLAPSTGVTYSVGFTISSGTVKLYINGALDGTPAAYSGNIATSSTVSLPVGAWKLGGSFGQYFAGTIDEVAYWAGTALSATDHADLHAAATAVGSATVPAVAATATATAVVPVVSASSGVVPPAATATATALPPAVTGTGDGTVLAVAATATAAAVAPTLTADAAVGAVAATASATALAPTLAISTTVEVVAATATADAIAPVVDDGSGSQTVFAVAATATATALAPTWTQILETSADTTNARNGRRRLAYATVTITRPVAAPPDTLTLATRVDKALAYPVPDMVDGRPT